MKRTDAPGNDSGRYTEGNPSLGVAATTVSASSMNNIQEEIVNVVLAAGITLDGLVETQLLSALREIIKRGGEQFSESITDNVVTPQDVTDVVFDKAEIKAARLLFNIHRRDDTQHADETGEMYIWHDTETDTWELSLMSHNDNAGVTFSITAAGQVQYISTNFGGASYSGTLRVTNITTIRQ